MTWSSCVSNHQPSGYKDHERLRTVNLANFLAPPLLTKQKDREIQTQFELIGAFEDTIPVFSVHSQDLEILTCQDILIY